MNQKTARRKASGLSVPWSGGLNVLGASALRSLLDVELDLLATGESIEVE
jgi:hypothetical protein